MEVINFNKLMVKMVSTMLKPYGLKRFRRYKGDLFFIDDQGWFITIFDFQIHEDKGEKSVYISCGIDFNWNLSSSIGYNFSDDFDVNVSFDFINEKQFSDNLIKSCVESLKKYLEYRDYLKNIEAAERFILKHKFGADGIFWTNYNRGIISGLAGNIENLNKYFDKILTMNEKNNRYLNEQWIIEFKKVVLELKNIANKKDKNKFIKKMLGIMNKTRELKKLDKMQKQRMKEMEKIINELNLVIPYNEENDVNDDIID